VSFRRLHIIRHVLYPGLYDSIWSIIHVPGYALLETKIDTSRKHPGGRYSLNFCSVSYRVAALQCGCRSGTCRPLHPSHPSLIWVALLATAVATSLSSVDCFLSICHVYFSDVSIRSNSASWTAAAWFTVRGRDGSDGKNLRIIRRSFIYAIDAG